MVGLKLPRIAWRQSIRLLSPLEVLILEEAEHGFLVGGEVHDGFHAAFANQVPGRYCTLRPSSNVAVSVLTRCPLRLQPSIA